MPKSIVIIVVAILFALVGGGITAAYYQSRVEEVRAEEALISLSDHSSILSVLQSGDVRGATRFLTTLADADVMRLMKVQGPSERRSDFGRKVLTRYADFRSKNPQFYSVPDYVDKSGHAEYEQNLKSIQEFLDQARSSPTK